MKSVICTLTFLAMATLLMAAAPAGWKSWTADKFGVTLYVPDGLTLTYKDFGRGWIGYTGRSTGLHTMHVFGNTSPTLDASALQSVAESFANYPSRAWVELESKTNAGGWAWYKSYIAQSRVDVTLAVLGNGKAGSYVAVLRTSRLDYEKNKAAYSAWHRGITVK